MLRRNFFTLSNKWNRSSATMEMINKTVLVKGDPSSGSPKQGDYVIVDYTGWLQVPGAALGTKGAKFDSSVDRGQRFSFQLKTGQVIQGWDIAVNSMVKGEKCQVVLPPSLAYGSRGVGPIPANSTLIFEIQLHEWTDKGPSGGAGSTVTRVAIIFVIGYILWYLFGSK
jgi:FKBP-type peptidyl-prolyl cis-trans isomerase